MLEDHGFCMHDINRIGGHMNHNYARNPELCISPHSYYKFGLQSGHEYQNFRPMLQNAERASRAPVPAKKLERCASVGALECNYIYTYVKRLPNRS